MRKHELGDRQVARFSGDTEPYPTAIWRRADPRVFVLLVTGRMPEARVEDPETVRARAVAQRPYTEEERRSLVTPQREALLRGAGPAGERLADFILTGNFEAFQQASDQADTVPTDVPSV